MLPLRVRRIFRVRQHSPRPAKQAWESSIAAYLVGPTPLPVLPGDRTVLVHVSGQRQWPVSCGPGASYAPRGLDRGWAVAIAGAVC